MRRKTTSGLNAGAVAVSTGLGALAAYFLDPDRGRSRRAETADRIAGLARRAGRRAGRGYRYARSTAAGLGERMVSRATSDGTWMNDETLAHKVESELFRDSTIPKGSINVNAEHGTVILRGLADSQDQIEKIMVAVMAIDGVKVVRSLLRTASQPVTSAFERKRELTPTTATSKADR